jgi:hypothetical protein
MIKISPGDLVFWRQSAKAGSPYEYCYFIVGVCQADNSITLTTLDRRYAYSNYPISSLLQNIKSNLAILFKTE